jgi:hypothetical protein
VIGRRGFLAALAAAFVVDPDRLLYVPGKKFISIPAPPLIPLRWMQEFDLRTCSMVSAIDTGKTIPHGAHFAVVFKNMPMIDTDRIDRVDVEHFDSKPLSEDTVRNALSELSQKMKVPITRFALPPVPKYIYDKREIIGA